jgi:hypothetical protein
LRECGLVLCGVVCVCARACACICIICVYIHELSV